MPFKPYEIKQPIPLILLTKPHEGKKPYRSNLRTCVEVRACTHDRSATFAVRAFRQNERNLLLGLTIGSEIVIDGGWFVKKTGDFARIIHVTSLVISKSNEALRIPRPSDPNGRVVWRWQSLNQMGKRMSA